MTTLDIDALRKHLIYQRAEIVELAKIGIIKFNKAKKMIKSLNEIDGMYEDLYDGFDEIETHNRTQILSNDQMLQLIREEKNQIEGVQ